MTSVLDNHEVLRLENNPLSGTSDMPNFVIIKIEAGNNAIHQFYLSNLNDVLQPPIINHPRSQMLFHLQILSYYEFSERGRIIEQCTEENNIPRRFVINLYVF